MKRILFCLDYYYPHVGGSEVLFANLAEGLVRCGWRVQVLTQAVSGSPGYELYCGVEIYRVSSHGNRYLFSILCLPFLWKLCAEADIVHATTFASTLPAWLITKLRRKPLALTVHEVWVGRWRKVSDASALSNWLNDKIERFIYWFDYQNYVAVSKATAQRLLEIGIPEDKVRVIYNGLDYGKWTGLGRDRDGLRRKLGLDQSFVFFFSGRPGCSKGFPVLLKAFAETVKERPDTRLLALLSNSPAVRQGYDEAMALIKELGLSDKVVVHEPVPGDELPDYVYCADTVVVPSLSEGFGFAAAEACAMERPIIVTDNASLPEVVSGKTLTVPPGDAEKLHIAMQRALKDEFEETPLRCFHMQDNVQNYLALYREILDGQKA